jgi:hypothetical protein
VLFDVGLPLTQNIDGGTLMHELGHNLGLGHGAGADGAPSVAVNRSPTYFSVMNYNYQMLGVPIASALGVGTASAFALQYSDVTCAALDEDHLDDTAGAQCGAASKADHAELRARLAQKSPYRHSHVRA